MKIFLTSDIHTERAQQSFDPHFDYQCLKFRYPEDVDVVVLAGDIGEWINGLEWARNRFANKEIVYVPGNHEYYDSDLSIIDDMRLKAKELDIHLLDNDSVIIDGVRFLGTTLWTNFDNYSAEAISEAERNMQDYHYVKCKKWLENRRNWSQASWLMNSDSVLDSDFLSPTVAYLLHREAINWLSQQLNENHQELHEGKTIIVSHHSPSMRSSMDHAYASNLEEFIVSMADKINVWFHGHVHEPVDYYIAGVRVVSNPRGYPGHHSGFDEGKIIRL
jgi:predicted phosphodiesterase